MIITSVILCLGLELHCDAVFRLRAMRGCRYYNIIWVVVIKDQSLFGVVQMVRESVYMSVWYMGHSDVTKNRDLSVVHILYIVYTKFL